MIFNEKPVGKKEADRIKEQARELALNNRAAFKLPYPQNIQKFAPAAFFLQSGRRGRIFAEEYRKFLI